jgi:hypothetical protein
MIREMLFALGAGAALAAHAADHSGLAGIAADWAEARAAQALERGVPLTRDEAAVARAVGVRDPSRVRIELVDALPAPGDASLVAASTRIGLVPQAADGMTLGYAVLLRRDARSDARLLRHELRHVAQYEAQGGIRPFLAAHIPALIRFGYRDSPFERDARAHEAD